MERAAWEPDSTRIPPNKRMPVRMALGEKALGRKVKAASGRWNRKRGVWELAYKDVLALGLTERIVQERDD